MTIPSDQIEELQEHYPTVARVGFQRKNLNFSFQLAQNGGTGYILAGELQGALKLLGIDLPGYQVKPIAIVGTNSGAKTLNWTLEQKLMDLFNGILIFGF